MRENPIGKAQKLVLDALYPGNKVAFWSTAEERFAELGLVVTSRREGRSSVPVVTIKARAGSGLTCDGDGDTWQEYAELTAEQLEAIKVWTK